MPTWKPTTMPTSRL